LPIERKGDVDAATSGLNTASLEGARDHARSQAGAVAQTQLTIPASAAAGLPEGVSKATVIWDETVGAGGYTSRRLPRDGVVHIADEVGDACVHLVVFRADNPAERINVADTVKVQWRAYLGAGAQLLSDMGRVLMTIVDDTSQRHDALCGCSNRQGNDRRYGDGGIHGRHPNGRDLLVVAAAKHGLERRDVPTGVNLFKRARVGDDGTLRFDGEPAPVTAVTLRAEMDVIVALANVPHPLDPRPAYLASTVRCTAWRATRPDDDPFRATSPERLRAVESTEDLLLGGGSS